MTIKVFVPILLNATVRETLRKERNLVTYPIGTPKEDVNSNHGEHESRHLPMRSFLVLGLVLWTDCAQLSYHKIIENED